MWPKHSIHNHKQKMWFLWRMWRLVNYFIVPKSRCCPRNISVGQTVGEAIQNWIVPNDPLVPNNIWYLSGKASKEEGGKVNTPQQQKGCCISEEKHKVSMTYLVINSGLLCPHDLHLFPFKFDVHVLAHYDAYIITTYFCPQLYGTDAAWPPARDQVGPTWAEEGAGSPPPQTARWAARLVQRQSAAGETTLHCGGDARADWTVSGEWRGQVIAQRETDGHRGTDGLQLNDWFDWSSWFMQINSLCSHDLQK